MVNLLLPVPRALQQLVLFEKYFYFSPELYHFSHRFIVYQQKSGSIRDVVRNHPLQILFFLALALRFVFFLQLRPWQPEVVKNTVLQFDAIEYDALGKAISQQGHFSLREDGAPDPLRTPIYPLVVAGFYKLCGPLAWPVLLFQILLDALVPLLLFLLMRPYFSFRAAFTGALLYAVDPFLLYYANTLLSDSLFVFSLVLATFVLSRAFTPGGQNIRFRFLCAAGLLFGLSALVKPVAVYLVLFMAPGIFITLYGQKDAAKAAFSFTVAFMLALAPWVARNELVFGSPMLSTSASLNFLVLNVTPVIAEKDHLDSRTAYTRLLHEADSLASLDGKQSALLNDFEKTKYWKQTALHYIRQNPGLYSKYYANGILHLYSNLETKAIASALSHQTNRSDIEMGKFSNPLTLLAEWFKVKPPGEIVFGIALACYLLFLYGCSLAGYIQYNMNGMRRFRGFIGGMLLYFTVLTGVAGAARFRLPLLPFLFILAGIGIDVLLKRNTTQPPISADH